mgnify:CR=1 FL=1
MCVFCEILRGNTPARWVKKPSDDAVDISCFYNRLKWAETMLLIVPNKHLTQNQYWKSNLIFNAIQLAIKLGDKFCRHSGFRIISNFGKAAHQSQNHGHLHMISGTTQQKNATQEKHLDWIGEIGYKTIFQNNDNEILFMNHSIIVLKSKTGALPGIFLAPKENWSNQSHQIWCKSEQFSRCSAYTNE